MNETRRDTFNYKGLGFPIRLVNVPMKKFFDEWVLDIDFNLLQKVVLHSLARKPSRLTGDELYFIRNYLELSTHSFAQLFGVTHTAVLKWENENSKMNPSTEIYMRLYLLDHLKVSTKEFRAIFKNLSLQAFANRKQVSIPLEIDADRDLIAC